MAERLGRPRGRGGRGNTVRIRHRRRLLVLEPPDRRDPRTGPGRAADRTAQPAVRDDHAGRRRVRRGLESRCAAVQPDGARRPRGRRHHRLHPDRRRRRRRGRCAHLQPRAAPHPGLPDHRGVESRRGRDVGRPTPCRRQLRQGGEGRTGPRGGGRGGRPRRLPGAASDMDVRPLRIGRGLGRRPFRQLRRHVHARPGRCHADRPVAGQSEAAAARRRRNRDR